MMSRQKLHEIKTGLRDGIVYPELAQLLHSLVDSNLEALDALEGGKTVQQHRGELQERERQIRLALKDLRAAITLNDGHNHSSYDCSFDINRVGKAVFTLDMVEQMLKATGTKWRREWAWYQPRIEEEFDG